MPTYEYACTACANEWEEEQSIKDPPLTECPKCHHATAKRQISRGAGFILKGGGWYSDLYSSSSTKKADAGTATSEGASTSAAPAAAATTAAPATAPASGSTSSSTGSGSSSGDK